jgi:hypothetical protein
LINFSKPKPTAKKAMTDMALEKSLFISLYFAIFIGAFSRRIRN